MTRFWITLDQGVELVYKALEEAIGGETYISKIPSFKIVDLAKAMLDDCVLKEVGIREGEKIHEIMVTKDDSRFTFEFDRHFIITPHFNWWKNSKNMIENGKNVKSGFEYTSGGNNEWLDVDNLRRELKRNGFI